MKRTSFTTCARSAKPRRRRHFVSALRINLKAIINVVFLFPQFFVLFGRTPAFQIYLSPNSRLPWDTWLQSVFGRLRSIISSFCHPDILQCFLHSWLYAFRHFVKHIRYLMYPAPLLSRFGPELNHSFPEAKLVVA